jgi:hypothetical protein
MTYEVSPGVHKHGAYSPGIAQCWIAPNLAEATTPGKASAQKPPLIMNGNLDALDFLDFSQAFR